MAQSREERLAAKKKYREQNKGKIKDYAIGHRKKYIKTHNGRALRLLASCRRRAKLSGSLMTLSKEWVLDKLEKGVCDVTGLLFSYEPSEKHTRNAFAPSVDRIDPQNTNYTEDNCRVVLWAVNNTFAEYGEEIMLPILEAIINVKQKSTSSVSNRADKQSKDDALLRSILRAGVGQNDNDFNHHSGAVQRIDIDHCTEESSRDRLAARDAKMGTLETSFRYQSYGVSCPAVEEFIRKGGHLSNKS